MTTAPAPAMPTHDLADRLRRALEAHGHDGTEIHHVVDRELRGLEHEVAAENIKRAIESKYSNTISIDAVVEIVGKLREDGGLE